MGVADEKALVQDYDEHAISSLSYEGKLYGVPTDYNDLLPLLPQGQVRGGRPRSGQAAHDWGRGRRIQQAADLGRRQEGGPAADLVNPQWTLMQLLALVKGKGGTILSPDAGKATLATTPGVEALRYYGSLGNAKLSNPLSGFGLFATGEAAMLVSGLFAMDLFPTLNPKLTFGDVFDIAPMPRWDAGKPVAPAYTWGWAVAKQSKLPYTAWHFVDYLQRRGRRGQAAQGCQTSRRSRAGRSYRGADQKALDIMATRPRTPTSAGVRRSGTRWPRR